MVTDLGFTPVIIIGAARSGTNILRDTLCALEPFSTWDCDEINPIWRHGNDRASTDSFGPENATAQVRSFIRRAFVRQWDASGRPPYLVEKTCANSLRVPFVQAILPEARFLYIVRDGIDVVRSAAKRWKGELEVAGLPYFLAKVRNTPLPDLPAYGWRFMTSRLGQLSGRSERLSRWGPHFDDLDHYARSASITELCARQWAVCVDASDGAFAGMPSDRWFGLTYEEFVREPLTAIRDILQFLGAGSDAASVRDAVKGISSGSLGKGRRVWDDDLLSVLPLMRSTLTRHGYSAEMEILEA